MRKRLLFAGLITAAAIAAGSQIVSHRPEGLIAVIQHERELSAKRSSQWPALRDRYLKDHPFCAYCGRSEKLQIHHVKPFHLNPDLELDYNNLITLCEVPPEDHHLNIGHAGNFKNANPNVREDCKKHEQELRDKCKWPR